jgi:hypothetical protein
MKSLLCGRTFGVELMKRQIKLILLEEIGGRGEGLDKSHTEN